jgi:hypothetical protein
LRHGEFFYTAACCNWRDVCHCYGSATFGFVTEQFAALVLAVMGAIYAGFALQKGNLFQIPAEVAPSVLLLPISCREFGTMRITKGGNLLRDPGNSLSSPHVNLPGAPVAAASLAVIWSMRTE